MANEETFNLALEAFDVTIEGDAAKLLLDMVSPVLSYDEPTSIRLVVGDGHSGYGLYAACAEYQEEGAVLLVSTTPQQRKPLTDETRNWIVATCPTPRHIIDAVERMHGIKE